MNEFEKELLKESILKKLLNFQTAFTRPQLIGLITVDNCLDFASHYDHFVREINCGNIYSSYEKYEYYCKIFEQYLSLLDDNEPIYPSKEIFINSLFINGEYKFLNFSSFSDHKNYQYFLNEELVTVTQFEKINFKSINQIHNKSKMLTKISKNNVVRFYDKKILNPEHWDDINCYLTLSLGDISDKEFKELFASSNFKSFRKDNYFKIHEFIKLLIKNGEQYSLENPLGEDYYQRALPRNFDEANQLFIYDITNDELIKKEVYIKGLDEISDSYSVGSLKCINNIEYEVLEIKTSCKPYIEIFVKKVGQGL